MQWRGDTCTATQDLACIPACYIQACLVHDNLCVQRHVHWSVSQMHLIVTRTYACIPGSPSPSPCFKHLSCHPTHQRYQNLSYTQSPSLYNVGSATHPYWVLLRKEVRCESQRDHISHSSFTEFVASRPTNSYLCIAGASPSFCAMLDAGTNLPAVELGKKVVWKKVGSLIHKLVQLDGERNLLLRSTECSRSLCSGSSITRKCSNQLLQL